MGYPMKSGRWADTRELAMHDSASEAVSGNSGWHELGYRGTARLTLDTTAGTGALDVRLETSPDGVNFIRTVDAFVQVTGVNTQRMQFSGLDRFVRAVWAIGTGPFTFSLTGEAC